MDGDLYDEFGNYIGPDLESDEEEENIYGLELAKGKSHYNEDDDEEQDEEMNEREGMQMEVIDEDHDDGGVSSAVVLHEVGGSVINHLGLGFIYPVFK